MLADGCADLVSMARPWLADGDIIANNAAQVEDYRNSDDAKKKKKIGFFVGQAMKATQGKANPQQLNQLLQKKLQ